VFEGDKARKPRLAVLKWRFIPLTIIEIRSGVLRRHMAANGMKRRLPSRMTNVIGKHWATTRKFNRPVLAAMISANSLGQAVKISTTQML